MVCITDIIGSGRSAGYHRAVHAIRRTDKSLLRGGVDLISRGCRKTERGNTGVPMMRSWYSVSYLVLLLLLVYAWCVPCMASDRVFNLFAFVGREESLS